MNIDDDSKKSIAMNIQLSPIDKQMLEKLKGDTGKTFGALVREGIRLRFRMRFNNEPSCANGTACKCPQMHQMQVARQTTDAELLAKEGADNGPAEE